MTPSEAVFSGVTVSLEKLKKLRSEGKLNVEGGHDR
jgi:hypothetical protein